MRHPVLAALAVMVLTGCVFVNLQLTPGIHPLQETVIEGKGDAKLLLMEITGVIIDREQSAGLGTPGEAPVSARVREELAKASEDKSVKGVILRINSPGGSVATTDVIYHEITEFKKNTNIPVYASIVGLGASGGMYVASAADRIYAQPASITGSIGVIAVTVDASGLMDKVGLHDKTYRSGEMKGVPSPFRPDTDEERRMVQHLIDEMYDRFVTVVTEGRKGKMTREQVLAVSDGRPLTAHEAHVAGLIDELGYPEDVVTGMKRDLKLKDATVVAYGRPGAYRGSIYSMTNVQGNVLVNIDAGALGIGPGMRFLYLWTGSGL